MLRLIASEWERAEQILRDSEILVSTSDVISVSVPDRPGGLALLLKVLADNRIDISYMYSVFGSDNGLAHMIFRIPDPAAFEEVLKNNGFSADPVDKLI